MNLVESTVIEVYDTEIYTNQDDNKKMWCVNVLRNCYGRIDKGTVYCFSEEEAKLVVPGYTYMS